MNRPETIARTTAADAARRVAGFSTSVEQVQLDALLGQRPRKSGAGVFIVRVPADSPVDVGAMRWMHPGGISPLVFVPWDFESAIDLASAAAAWAVHGNTPVYLLLEDEVASATGEMREPAPMQKPAPLPPVDAMASGPERVLRVQAALAEVAPQLALMNPDPAGRTAEWLVISYGSCVAPSLQAVRQARAAGQRVHHLSLQTLWPVPEPAIVRAAMGVKHVVMPERNLGQYILELRRVLPMLTIVPAGSAGSPVTAELILDRLRNTPRCC